MNRFSSVISFVLAAGITGLAAAHGGGVGDESVTPVAAAVLPSQANPHAVAVRVEFPPGGASPAHTHPGPVFAVVVSGEIESGLDGEAPQRFKAGQAWYEAPGQVHRVTRNGSKTEPATVVAWILSDGKAALVSPVTP